MNHPHILSNTSHHELQCPRTCEISSPLQNTCMSPSKKGEDGRCYCPDGSLVVPKFLKDRKLFLPTDHLATLELCSHQPNVTLLPTAGTHNVTLSPTVSTLSNIVAPKQYSLLIGHNHLGTKEHRIFIIIAL